MTCRTIQKKLPGYLDGALPSVEQATLAQHLAHCVGCRAELEATSRVSGLLARAERALPPAGLALRIRVAVAHERMQESWFRRTRRRVQMTMHDVLRPLVVPATGGVLMSFAVYCLLLQSMLGGLPIGNIPNDQPINMVQSARLESLAPFPLHVDSVLSQELGSSVNMVEFRVNSDGRALSYQILSGQADRDTRRQLDQLMMFSSFRPQLSFGRPTGDGRVVVRFDEFRVSE